MTLLLTKCVFQLDKLFKISCMYENLSSIVHLGYVHTGPVQFLNAHFLELITVFTRDRSSFGSVFVWCSHGIDQNKALQWLLFS